MGKETRTSQAYTTPKIWLALAHSLWAAVTHYVSFSYSQTDECEAEIPVAGKWKGETTENHNQAYWHLRS